ncbi:MAG: BON domain-containing protein [Nitrosomonas sp.]|nr:BON domain-containing protein [Nitrosomonas sp.]MDP1950906.1 BON domain-containing protein [Nitrosomonas sp.]
MKNLYFNGLLLTLLIPALVGCVPLFAVGVGAGAGTGAYMSVDRRTSGIFVEDEGIELRTARRISQQLGNSVHINVTSFNRNVLLTGEAPTETAKQEIEKLAMSVQNVRNIVNEIKIAGNTSLHSRSTDAVTTSKVKTRFLHAGQFQINHVKIITENGIVYLMGLVKHREAESAAEIASTTSGVLKVVKVFEFLD